MLLTIRTLIILGLLGPLFISTNAQTEVLDSFWPAECQKVEISSTLDQEIQSAYFLSSKGNELRPLIVSLHTWSGDYTQKDSLAWQCLEKDYNYIHPDFRGPNNNPKACGSEYAIQDINDAIEYAIANAYVDTNEIHIIGASGGGYATLFMYMHAERSVKTFSAWVPISDLEKWYHESEGRGNKYARNIANATVSGKEFKGDSYYMNADEARRRSPFFMHTPIGQRSKSKLFISAGIHDGYTGSVPISQSILFYNKVVRDYDPAEKEALVPDYHLLEMLSSRQYQHRHKVMLGDRILHYEKSYQDLIQLRIFEGGHEMLNNVALNPVEGRKILILGDSNGASAEGWVTQLKRMRFSDSFHNTSISGNTIGFDNLGRKQLNTLRHIDRYLNEAQEQLHGLDDIIIMLGTNDCKAVFDERLEEVPENLKLLISKIKEHPVYQKKKPKIYIVSPPPYGKDEVMLEKYHGGAKRIAWLYPRFREISEKNGCIFVDVYSKLLPDWAYLAPEGIHPRLEAQRTIARSIGEMLEE